MKAIRGFAVVFIVAAGILISVCAGQGNDEQEKIRIERRAWVQQCLTDFKSIKTGMTRVEVETKLRIDGGLQGVSPVRYIHPDCDYFKIDVEFDFKRNEKNQNRAILSPEDRVTIVSRPYIDFPVFD